MKTARLSLIVIIVLSLFGCASGGSDSLISEVFKGNRPLTEGVNRVFIEQMADSRIDSTLRGLFTDSLVSKIKSEPRLAVAEYSGRCELNLKVVLREYTSEPVSYNSAGVVEKFRIRIVSLVWISAVPGGELKVNGKQVEAELVYSETVPPVLNEYSAMKLLADRLAERITSVIITGWYIEK